MTTAHVGETNNWEMITYDLWGNDEDGYEVNQAFTTGRVYDIDDWENDVAVLTVLRDNEFPNIDVNDPAFDVDGDEHVMYINHNGYPLCELRRTNDPAGKREMQ